MLARLSLGLALAAVLLALWLVSGDDRARPVVRAGAPDVARERSSDGPTELDAPEVDVARSIAPTIPPEGDGRTAAPPLPDVHVAVRIEPAEGSRAPADGWLVELQTWDEALDTVALHASAADAEGRAEFAFVGPVHVDWARVVPPESSGLAFAFVEEHVDLEPGAHHELVLEPGEGGRLGGVVLDLDGRPAAGARVHAYFEDSANDLEDWQPGPISAEVDAAGRFHFPRLQSGEWELCVEPGDWLAWSPRVGASEAALNEAHVRVGEEVDDVVLTVVRATPFRLRLVDGAGLPVGNASVQLEPQWILGGGALLEDPPGRDALDDFLDEAPVETAPAPPVWPYGTMSNRTRADGVVRLVGVPGVWTLSVWTPNDTPDHGPPLLRQRLELPGPDLTLELGSAFQRHRGRVIDASGSPIADVRVLLRDRVSGELLANHRSDKNGHFEFGWLRAELPYEIDLRRAGWISLRQPIEPTPRDAPDRDVVLRRGHDVALTFATPESAPLAQAWITIVEVRPADPRPEEYAAVDALLNVPRRTTDEFGVLRLEGVPAGELVIGLRRRVAALDGQGGPLINVFGVPRTEDPVVHTWTVRVPDGERRLVVDVSRWPEPAPIELPRHAGRVFDVASGAPLPGAKVILLGGDTFRIKTCDEGGRFELAGLVGPHALFAYAEGYAAESTADREWSVLAHEHAFALRRGTAISEIVLADRNGVVLPTVLVRFVEADGTPRRVLAPMPDGGARLTPACKAVDGRFSLLGTHEGELEIDVYVDSYGSIGRCRIHFDERSGEPVEVRLERTLDEVRAEILRERAEED